MSGNPITVYNRYRGAYEEEAVYGESALRFAYETSIGRAATTLFFSRPLLSRIFGWYMKRPASRAKIGPFVEKYDLDPAEFARSLEDYESFNAFFCRELNPDARPVDSDPCSVVFPADGRHFGWENLGEESQVFVKGQAWDIPQLLGGNAELIDIFRGGALVLSRLCPVDYHHFHYPAGGKVGPPRWMDNRLYSVSPIALRRRLAYIWQNRRCLSLIDSSDLGTVGFIEVGATNVGTIQHHPLPEALIVSKGDPKGWFEFGGSSVITLFRKGAVSLSDDLLSKTAEGVELYARVGDRMGTF